ERDDGVDEGTVDTDDDDVQLPGEIGIVLLVEPWLAALVAAGRLDPVLLDRERAPVHGHERDQVHARTVAVERMEGIEAVRLMRIADEKHLQRSVGLASGIIGKRRYLAPFSDRPEAAPLSGLDLFGRQRVRLAPG